MVPPRPAPVEDVDATVLARPEAKESCKCKLVDAALSDLRTNSKSRRKGSFLGNLRKPGGAAGPTTSSPEDVSERSRSSMDTISNCHGDGVGGARIAIALDLG